MRSIIAVWYTCAVLLVLHIVSLPPTTLTWDVFGYYLYLPAIVIHDDPALKDHAWLDEVMTTYEPSGTLYQVVDAPDGGRVIKYSAGMAIAYAPFFLIAHGVASLLGYPADGFSPPYQLLITFGCLCYALIGLLVLRKVLLYFLSDGWVAATLVLIVFGTNLLQLTALGGTLLTHSFLFTLYAVLLLATIRWHEQPTWKQALAIGVSAGFITLVRPSEAVCLLIPLLWLPARPNGWRRKLELLRKHAGHVALVALAFGILLLPQAFYWHAVTGRWIFYSYVNPGEGFEFASPYLRKFLIGFRKGWLVYTPLMLFALAGFVPLWRRQRQAFWAVLLFFLVDLWVIASWSCWWYAGGSFSSRSLLPAYTVLAIPLGLCVQALWSRRALRWPVGGTLAALVALNLFQTWQFEHGVIDHERMTRRYYLAVFGRTSVPPGAKDLLLVDRPTTTEEVFADEARYNAHELCHYTFDDRPDSVYTLTAENPYSPGPDVRYADLTERDHAWLRATARVWIENDTTHLPVIVMTFNHDGQTYKYRTSSNATPAGTHRWVELRMDYLTPEVRSTADNLKVYLWDQHGGTWRVDDLRVEVFERND
ncbi:MAG: hypothetical protein QM724_02665 [Flavobacteriales bacterium]